MARSWSHAVLLVALLAAAAARAQDAGDWLASARAREFRMRVAQLAVIYGDSRGIDPHGLLVTARSLDGAQAGCADVDIVVFAKGQELLRERVCSCRHGAKDEAGRCTGHAWHDSRWTHGFQPDTITVAADGAETRVAPKQPWALRAPAASRRRPGG